MTIWSHSFVARLAGDAAIVVRRRRRSFAGSERADMWPRFDQQCGRHPAE